MGFWKERWINAYDTIYQNAIENGATEEEATALAERDAGSVAYERLAGAADNMRKAMKENA